MLVGNTSAVGKARLKPMQGMELFEATSVVEQTQTS